MNRLVAPHSFTLTIGRFPDESALYIAFMFMTVTPACTITPISVALYLPHSLSVYVTLCTSSPSDTIPYSWYHGNDADVGCLVTHELAECKKQRTCGQ